MKTSLPLQGPTPSPSPAELEARAHAADAPATDAAPPDAARRFRALMAQQQGAAARQNDDANVAHKRDEGGKRAQGDTRSDAALLQTRDGFVEHANTVQPWDASRERNARESGDADGSDGGSDSRAADHALNLDNGIALPSDSAAADKRSWGARGASPRALAPPSPRPVSLSRAADGAASAALDGPTRRPSRTRHTVGAAATTSQRLRHDSAEDADSGTARAETLSRLVAQTLAEQTPVQPDTVHGDLHAPDGTFGAAITIRIDHVFPETLLTLTISESSLSLRFESGSAESRALLFDQRHALSSRVTKRTGRPTHIDIVA